MASEEEEEESAQLVACEIVEWEEARVNPKCRLVRLVVVWKLDFIGLLRISLCNHKSR